METCANSLYQVESMLSRKHLEERERSRGDGCPKNEFYNNISKGLSIELVNQMANAKGSSKYPSFITLLSRVFHFSRNGFVGVFFKLLGRKPLQTVFRSQINTGVSRTEMQSAFYCMNQGRIRNLKWRMGLTTDFCLSANFNKPWSLNDIFHIRHCLGGGQCKVQII